MTFEQSLAALFVISWVAIILGWTIQSFFFKS